MSQEVNDSRWNDEIETAALRMSERAELYSKTYEKMMAAAKKTSDIIIIASGILGGLLGTFEIFFKMFGNDNVSLNIIKILISYAVSVLCVIKCAWKLEDSIKTMMVSRLGYDNLSSKIKSQILMDEEDRMDAVTFIKEIFSTNNMLKSSSILVDEKVRNAAKKELLGGSEFDDIPIPNLRGGKLNLCRTMI
jgi:hypothetical protein